MNNDNLPINVKEITNLNNHGINSNLCKFGSLSFESDKYICAKDVTNDGQASIKICELEKNMQIITKNLAKVDAAMMHPSRNIIAVRAKVDNKTVIQVLNFENNDKLKNIEISQEITFWRWLDEQNIGIVTATSVYVLSITSKDSPAKKVFDRSGNLANSSVFVMNLKADANLTWYALSGVSSFKDNSGKAVINGYIQLYSTSVGQSQPLEGFCGTFSSLKIHSDERSSIVSFIEKKANTNKYNLILSEVTGGNKFKQNAEVPMQTDNDFPVLSCVLENYGLIYVVTNQGYLYIYEASKAILVFRCKISEDSCLFNAVNSKGALFINKSGKLISAFVEKQNLIPFMMQYCKNTDNIMEVCTTLAQRYGLPGAERIFDTLFKNHMNNGNFEAAAQVCRDTPGDTLRNLDTINLFKSKQGNPQPILVYFQTVMGKNRLNQIESIEIVKPLVQQNKKQFIENWFKEGKFTCSEELAEIVKPCDSQLSLKILVDSGSPSAHGKIIEGLVSTGNYDKIFPYCQQHNYKADYVTILKNVIAVDAPAASGLAKLLCNRSTGVNLIDVSAIIEIFSSRKRIQELTTFMVEYLKDNRSEDSFLQTKILELNLYESPNAAQVILENNLFSHYDKIKIANLCEKMGLLQIALDNYTDIKDIKRIMYSAHLIKPNFLIEYFGRLTPENQLTCLHELLKANPMHNLNLVVEIAVKYASRIPVTELIKLFETYNNHQGLFVFINRIVNVVDDPEIMFKYIQSGVITNNFNEVQRIIKEYENYDPLKVLDFFLEKKLVDHRPLIILCDKHDYIDKLALYLYKNRLTKVLENYVFQVRPQSTPRVLATLLDEDCDENYIKQILNTVRANCPIEPLVEEFQKRHKLKVLQKFLEDREQEGNNQPALHNALLMIYIDINNNPKDHLLNNKYYDSKAVGKYCEDRDPHLACIAYRRAAGSCDDELIELTNKMGLYRLQAQYLVDSLNPDLWTKVLDGDNEHKKAVTDQVITVILPQTRGTEEVSVTVKAFIDAGLQADLMDLLEKLVLHNPEFTRNASLQNLLILTAITSAPEKVKAFLNRLDCYHGKDLAKKCLENNLFEEAFFIYDKNKEYDNAIDVLLEQMEDLKRATIYAEKINTNEVWSRIGKAKLRHQIVDEAIEAFIKSEFADCYTEVISLAEREGKYEELIKYLLMVREQKKDKMIDGELVYAYAKCDKLVDIESFISTSNTADLGVIADRLYDEQAYPAAKIIYENVGNNARLASCLVHLKEYQKAVLAAKKANSPKCWKEVCFGCVKGGEFRLASQAGSQIIIHPDLVDELIKGFEKYGAYSELISLFEANLSQERNHIYTELGILYAKYQENKLMDYCRNSYEKINVPKLIRICESHYHWNEVVFLHCHYNGHDSAIEVMIEHSPIAFKHDLFIQTLQKIANTLLFNKAIHFYMSEQPQLINDMLKVVSSRLDLSQTVVELRKTDSIAMFLPFLKSVQSANNYDVNEALNEIFVDEEDADNLKNSILEYNSFDQISLAKKIENHSLLEFRRISALVYRKNKKYQQSIEISKKLEYYKDAIETAFESGNQGYCEELLRFFAQQGDKECFCSCLYTCYDQIKPDIAMELAWRYDFNEFLMPYMIQYTRETNIKLETVQRKLEDTEVLRKKKDDEVLDAPLDVGVIPMSNQLVHVGGGMGMGMDPYNNQMNNNMNNMGGNNMNNNMNNMSNMSGNNNMNQGGYGGY